VSLGIELGAASTAQPAGTLLLPRQMRRRLYVPETAHVQKIVYFKGRPFGARQWYGDARVCHYNIDLDEPGRDGLSIRDQIHLYLTGLCERAGYRWVYQGSDERQGTTMIEEWPLWQHSQERWDRFIRREAS
jgi:hypothetical protein